MLDLENKSKSELFGPPEKCSMNGTKSYKTLGNKKIIIVFV